MPGWAITHKGVHAELPGGGGSVVFGKEGTLWSHSRLLPRIVFLPGYRIEPVNKKKSYEPFGVEGIVVYILGVSQKKASVFLRTVNAQYSFLLLLGGAADQAGARGVAVPLFFYLAREPSRQSG